MPLIDRILVLALLASLAGVGVGVGYLFHLEQRQVELNLPITTKETRLSENAHTGVYDWDDVASGDVPSAAVKLLKEFGPGTYVSQAELVEVMGVGDLNGEWFLVCHTATDVVFIEPSLVKPYGAAKN